MPFIQCCDFLVLTLGGEVPDNRSDQELRGVTQGEASPRKKAVAKELLRRRHLATGRRWWRTWLPTVALMLAARLFRRKH